MPVATIKDGDAVIFFNFRADRARQLTRALAVEAFDGFPVTDRPVVDFVCFTLYDQTFNLPIAFPQLRHKNILAEVFAAVGVRNYRLAETEKYAHVTYFFNGGTEHEFPSERRLLVPSPKVATYDLMPEMSAFKVTDKILRAIEERETDVFIVNFANPDMVGHTGNLVEDHRGRPVHRHLPRLDHESPQDGQRPLPHHRRPRQLRTDDRPHHGSAPHRPHHQPRPLPFD